MTEKAIPVIRYAWLILVLAFLMNATPIALENRSEPLFPVLIESFDIQMQEAGFMKSVAGLTGLIMLLPSGIILQRYGIKKTGAAALFLLAAGAALGAQAQSFTILMISLFLEGIGGAMLLVLTGAAITMWFPPGRRGLPMGIYSTSLNFGGLVGLIGAPLLFASLGGWREVWWAAAGLVVVILLLYLLLFRPSPIRYDANGDKEQAPADGLKQVLTNRSMWLLGLTLFCFEGSYTAANFFPAFLITEKGFTPDQAGGTVGIALIAALFAGPLAGWISDRIGSRKKVILAGILLSLPLMFTIMHVPVNLYIPYMVGFGVAAGIFWGVVLTAIPELLANTLLIGIGLAFFHMFNYLGVMIANPLFGRIIDSFGWITVLNVSGVLGAFGVFTLLMIKQLD